MLIISYYVIIIIVFHNNSHFFQKGLVMWLIPIGFGIAALACTVVLYFKYDECNWEFNDSQMNEAADRSFNHWFIATLVLCGTAMVSTAVVGCMELFGS